MALVAAASARNLVVGSGNVSITSGSPVLTFVNSQSFKQGATVVVDYAGTSYYFTLDSGSDKTWVAFQNSPATASGKAFKTTDAGTGRNKGTDGCIVPNAMHFMYRAPIDGSSNPDWYFYIDTVFPEKGLHPYTKDQYTGSSVASSRTAQALIPDAATRLRILEGLLRGSTGDTASPDNRIDDLVSRVYALEGWANGVGHFGTPPAQGSNAAVSIQQALDYGDA